MTPAMAWATAVPLAFVTTTTLTAGFLSVRDNFLPMARLPGQAFQGFLDAGLTVVMMACVVLVLIEAALAWRRAAGRKAVPGAEDAGVRVA